MSDEPSISDVLQQHFDALLTRYKVDVPRPVSPDLVLLECGVDSLGYATLITQLEDELGYDPFLLMDEPVYPRTYGEFVETYERFAGHRSTP